MSQICPLTHEELDERAQKNFDRLCEPYYQIDQVFSPAAYDWPADKEGRALLAFACHLQQSGRTVPCLPLLLAGLDAHTNADGFFGPTAGPLLREQQLSGHSWLLRGLCQLYQLDGDSSHLQRARAVFEGLYLPTAGRYGSYPIRRPDDGGGVDGHSGILLDGWDLSTDIGCAFMSIDGLSHYYAVSHDARALTLLEEMVTVYAGMDKVALQAQTHCTLSAARGMLRLYEHTGTKAFLKSALDIWQVYLRYGMTASYQNYNWWGKGNTWTEPCAIVDSLLLTLQLYELTADDRQLTLARRIWHNGLASAQRPNGGAGTDSTVGPGEDTLYMQSYEAPFCCTMRLAEGLLWASEHHSELGAELTGELVQDARGRWRDGDLLYAQLPEDAPADLPERALARPAGNLSLTPLVKYYRLSDEVAKTLRQKLLFPKTPAKKPATDAADATLKNDKNNQGTTI